ncbi:MAG: N-formylglutamate amidohydrolase [Rhizomicrobium sp.]|nr:N-formylglutamate amidohydrolase [Rhizomicrobium sp.]
MKTVAPPFAEDACDDPVLAALNAEPVRLLRPKAHLTPFIFASPHSGRLYPLSFVRQSRLSPLLLRRSEDAFADELFDSVPGFGAPLLCARFPRAYVDANRAPGELDPEMFDAALPLAIDPPSPRVAAGLGVIPRLVREGADIYRARLAAEEAAIRLASLYHPYHDALAKLVEETYRRFGCAVVIDCHSMPSTPAAPSIVFGDCYGASVSPSLMRHAEDAFDRAGFSTARNAPYAGGHTTHLYARREVGIHALQIEVNRGLYLDEDRIEKLPSFAGVKGRLGAALRQLLRFEWTRLVQQRPLAAE